MAYASPNMVSLAAPINWQGVFIWPPTWCLHSCRTLRLEVASWAANVRRSVVAQALPYFYRYCTRCCGILVEQCNHLDDAIATGSTQHGLCAHAHSFNSDHRMVRIVIRPQHVPA
jgi:hypothetical protein